MKHVLLLICFFLANSSFAQIENTDSLRSASLSKKQDTLKIKSQLDVAFDIMMKNKPDTAKLLIEEALNLSKQIEYDNGVIYGLYLKGLYYIVKQNFSSSLFCFLESLQLAEKKQDHERVGGINMNIGNIYFWNEDYRKSLLYYFNAKKEAEKMSDQQWIGGVLLSIGSAYERLNSLDSARSYVHQAYKYAIKRKDTTQMLLSYLSLGEISYKMDQFKLAMDYYRFSLEHNINNSDDSKSAIFMGMAKVFDHEKMEDSAFYYATQSYNSDIKLNRLSDLETIRLIVKYYKTRNIDSAFNYQNILIQTKDSIFGREKLKQIETLSFNETLRQKKIEDDRIAAEKERKDNLQIIGIGTFILSCVLFLCYGFYRFRRREKLQNHQSLVNERLRISRELHDEVGATLSGIAMYSHLTKEQIKHANATEVEKSLNIMQQSAGEMVNKLNDIVWFINPDKDTLPKLIQRLEEYATDMAMAKNMLVKVNVPVNLAEHSLSIESRRNIYLFCKEAINNAVKYSNATLLELHVNKVDKNLEFSVSDNGKGFDAVLVRRGNGLDNMQKRADEIGATLTLQSKQDEGCFISMQLKIT
ncbi:MAG: histidine kinase [Chitinophagaceae bacterium]